MHTEFLGTIGKTLKLQTTFDLTGVDSVVFEVRKPDDSKVSWAATIADATNKEVTYTYASGDLNLLGRYVVQIKGTFTSPSKTLYDEPVTVLVKNVV
jgi:hypothetical protein